MGEEGLKQGTGGGGSTFYSSIDPRELFQQLFGNSNPFESMGGGGLFSGSGGRTPGSATFYFGSRDGGREGNLYMDGDEPMEFSSAIHGGSDAFGGFGGFGGSTRQSRQDPPVKCKVDLSLEELFQGCTKKMKISRKVLSPEGTTSSEDKVLMIDVKPGWKAGTKITFPREGDQSVGRIPADVIFVIGEKPHKHFIRDGHNLKYKAKISLKQALCGGQIKVPKIDGGHIALPLDYVISPDTVEIISGEGMPVSKQPGTRGDLIVNFNINFPESLPTYSISSLKTLLPD